VKHFKVAFSTLEGYVCGIDQLKLIIEEYETATQTKFIKGKKTGSFGKDVSQQG